MKLLIIDDHQLFRDGLKYLLSGVGENIEFYELDCAAAMADFPWPATVDLVLLDYHLPDASGLEALATARSVFERASVVVVSGEDEPSEMHRVILQGASGFIPKSSNSRVMLAALKTVLEGGVYLPPALLSQMDSNDALERTNQAALFQTMSKRQREVLLHTIQGKPNKVIAQELDISEHTVKAHLAVVFRLLNVKNRSEAVYAAARIGIVK